MALSAVARRAIYSQTGANQTFISLIRITGAGISGSLRFANARQDVPSRGAIYDATAFEAQVPPQVEGREPTVTITISNVDRTVEAVLATLTSEPVFVYEVVLASAPDEVVVGPFRLPLRSSQTSMNTIRLTLGGGDPIMSRKFPRAVYLQDQFPGLSVD